MKSILTFIVLFISLNILGQDTLRVAVKLDPPFTMKYDNGHYSGLCIDLLNGIDTPYTITEVTGTYSQIIDSLSTGNVDYDYFVAPTTITKSRIEKIDFSQPFFVTSTSIAYVDKVKPKFDIVALLIKIGQLALLVIVLGAIFFFIEGTKNDAIEKNTKGFMNSLIWVSATMTTVGEGFVVAKTRLGKFMSLTLMWVSMLLTGYMILQIDNATEKVNIGLADLKKCKVATIEGTYVSEFLDRNDIKYIAYDTAEEAFDAMNEGNLDAFVHDTPILQYLQGKDMYSGINLSKETFEQQTFGVAGKGPFKGLNSKILDFISHDEWKDILNKYNLE